MAHGSFHGDADPDVQLDIQTSDCISYQCCCRWYRPAFDDIIHEWVRHLSKIPIQKKNQVVEKDVKKLCQPFLHPH
jgi:hypothetical protein